MPPMSPPDGASNTPVFAVERDQRLRLLVPAVVAIAFLMEQLDSTIIVTALPNMAVSLRHDLRSASTWPSPRTS